MRRGAPYYSFGADVLPSMARRLPPATLQALAGVGLLGLSPTASFEFHVSDWLGGAGDATYDTRDEVNRLGVPTACVVGTAESDSACRGTRARLVVMPGGHHFGGDYARLARELLAALGVPPPPRGGRS